MELTIFRFSNIMKEIYKDIPNHIGSYQVSNLGNVKSVENLEIITNRENSNKKHLPSSSKYIGVYHDKRSKKWKSQIGINNKQLHLGYYINEIDAHNAYQEKLKEIKYGKR